MVSRVCYSLAQPSIFISPRCISLLCLENGDEVTSPWKQMLIPQLLSDVLQDDVSQGLVSRGACHPLMCLYYWVGMSRRFLPLLQLFLWKLKSKNELEIHLFGEEFYCKESKVLGVRAWIRDRKMKVMFSREQGEALETIWRRKLLAKLKYSMSPVPQEHKWRPHYISLSTENYKPNQQIVR